MPDKPKKFQGDFGDELSAEEVKRPGPNPLVGSEGAPPASDPVSAHVEKIPDDDLLAPPAKPGAGDDMPGAS